MCVPSKLIDVCTGTGIYIFLFVFYWKVAFILIGLLAGMLSWLELIFSAIQITESDRNVFPISKDAFKVLVVFFNLPLVVLFLIGTCNRLNDSEGGYENITVARHLGLPDLEMLQFVHSQITPGKIDFSLYYRVHFCFNEKDIYIIIY